MIGALPKLFGRQFFIGYLLPAALTLLGVCVMADRFGVTGLLAAATKLESAPTESRLAMWAGILLTAVWAWAMLLMAANVQIIRLLEGYGTLNPAKLAERWQVRRFRALTDEFKAIEKKRVDGKVPQALRSRHGQVVQKLGNEFPERDDLVLGTRFGNVVRAFERYPQLIYGLESIQGWMRLQAVIAAHYRDLLGDAKAQLDLWVNLWFGSVTVVLLQLGLGIGTSNWHATLADTCATIAILFATIVIALFAASCARMSASHWGMLVKGAFDLYRGELCRQMGFEMPRSIESEREMWTAVSRTMLSRRARNADAFTRFRPLQPAPAPTPAPAAGPGETPELS